MMVEKKTSSWEESFEKKMKKLEDRIEEIGKKIEERGEKLGNKIEEKAKTVEKNIKQRGTHGHSLFWGLVLLVVGILWLGNNLDWFIYDVPWFPVVMIAGGVYLILKNWEKDKSQERNPSEGNE